MLDEWLPSPTELNEYPELAALRILKTTLEVADRALVATHPECREHRESAESPSETEAYALATLPQIDTLQALLDLYVESVGRLRDRRHREAFEKNPRF